jgi:hypothetical protein
LKAWEWLQKGRCGQNMACQKPAWNQISQNTPVVPLAMAMVEQNIDSLEIGLLLCQAEIPRLAQMFLCLAGVSGTTERSTRYPATYLQVILFQEEEHTFIVLECDPV